MAVQRGNTVSILGTTTDGSSLDYFGMYTLGGVTCFCSHHYLCSHHGSTKTWLALRWAYFSLFLCSICEVTSRKADVLKECKPTVVLFRGLLYPPRSLLLSQGILSFLINMAATFPLVFTCITVVTLHPHLCWSLI